MRFRPVLHSVVIKSRYLQKIRELPSGTFSKTTDLEHFATVYRSSIVLLTSLKRGGRSERDRLDRRQSTKLTVGITELRRFTASLSQ